MVDWSWEFSQAEIRGEEGARSRAERRRWDWRWVAREVVDRFSMGKGG